MGLGKGYMRQNIILCILKQFMGKKDFGHWHAPRNARGEKFALANSDGPEEFPLSEATASAINLKQNNFNSKNRIVFNTS